MGRLQSIGWELNSTAAGIEFDVGVAGAGCSISTSTVRSGAGAGRVTGISSGAKSAFVTTINGITGTMNKYLRVYVRIASLPDATTSILDLATALGAHFGISCNSSGQLALYGGAVAGTLSPALTPGTWYRVEVHFDDTTTAGTHTFELRLDGTTVELATANNFSAVPTTCSMGANCRAADTATTIDIFFDDFALNDTVGSVQNSWPGAGSIVYLFPAAAGDNAAWTIDGSSPAATNWQSVKEHPPDDGITFIKRTTSTVKVDDYKVDSASGAGIGSTDAITLVHVTGRFGSTSASAATGRRLLSRVKSAAAGTVNKSAGAGVPATTGGTAGSIPVNTTTYATHLVAAANNPAFPQLVSYVDPTTAAVWTRDGTNSLSNMQIGIETEVSSTNEVHTSALWAIVEFVPPSQISSTESGAATDAGESIAASTSDTETGAATDAGSQIGASDVDAGAATDAGEAVAATLSDVDSGSALEGGEQVGAVDVDTGTGVDAGETIAATLTDPETAAAVDTESAASNFLDSDSGSGTDTGEAITAATSDDDPATADDEATLASTIVDVETATATDAALVDAGAPIDDSDSGSAGDEPAVAATFTDSELAAAVDDALAAVSFVDDDAAAIAEGSVIVLAIAGADTATAAESEHVETTSTSGSGWLVGASFL